MRWAAVHPVLAGIGDFDELCARRRDPEATPKLLAALAALAPADQLAVRVLLQALVPGLVLPCTVGSNEPDSLDEMITLAWERIATDPATRHGDVAANVLLDVRQRYRQLREFDHPRKRHQSHWRLKTTNWSDLDLEAGRLTVAHQLVVNKTTGKVEERPTKRPRDKATISLHPETVAKLKRRRKEQAAERLMIGSGWPGPDDLSYDRVVTYADGRVIRPDTLTKVLARMSVKAGLPRLTPHGQRHSFATAALKARVPVEVVAHGLGNTVAVVQDVYRHVIAAEDSEASRIVGDLYRRPPAPKRSDHGLSSCPGCDHGGRTAKEPARGDRL